jgi:hypothetical protein
MLLAGLLAMRHETVVAHVRDHSTGALHHAHELADRHEDSTTPHLHGRDVEAHDESSACALLAGIQKSTVLPSTARMVIAQPAVAVDIVTVVDAMPVVEAVYRLAPKMSPPALALAA